MMDDLVRRLRLRLALTATPMQAECPIPDCVTCEPPAELVIASPAAHLGRRPSHDQSIGEVACWLRDAWPEAWHDSELDELMSAAGRLIHLRDAVEAGR